MQKHFSYMQSLTSTHTLTHTCRQCQRSGQMHGDSAAELWINTLSVAHVKLHHCSHEHFRHLSLSLFQPLCLSATLSLITSTRHSHPSHPPIRSSSNGRSNCEANQQTSASTATTSAHQCTYSGWRLSTHQPNPRDDPDDVVPKGRDAPRRPANQSASRPSD